MTILGVPDGSGFTIGTSSNIASACTGASSSMDVSLDDMIKQRRTKSTNNRKASAVDKTVGRGRAKRQAAANARRGISDSKKPSKMEVDKEVKRETRRTARNAKNKPQPGRKPKSEAVIKTKAKQDKKRKQENKKKGSGDLAIPPTWIGGTRRPPSKKAVTAAVEAMKDSGFTVPKGMQMVISFAPAPNQDPTISKQPARNTKGNRNNSGGRGAGRGGGRSRGRGRGRN
mmetsp:Transcript_30515/g.46228  ORF Transcript_30515/g.46228 Transcript_30515/m.46228 type:complete len:229 (-) Transcript_30515:724-1410(-)|eukprot:CAMPEP_0178914994 /NCGR_PEP_ID=MMETSP0786-20121207/11760_1 /TAXON_ID=186022 /ORGANISM="Thalassionema frauenfeldii, Strain CCMP 1798" /LENGTH=228 /DNA_ID=CAMNT_0020588015 /DNA_START=55 /DNA_END=741 /DNA_ORIENTATION=-